MLVPDQHQIRSAARKVLAHAVGRKISDSEPVVSSGLVDSLAVLRVISELEKELSMKIPPQNLQPDDFDSVDVIVETVGRVARPR